MRIAYLSADFGVPIHGVKGASVHVREMVRALREAGHEVRVFSPAIDPVEERERPAAASAPPLEAARSALAGCVRVEPDPRHTALLDDLARIEERFDLKSRLRQELRNLLYAATFLERVRHDLRGWPVDFVYERYALFGHAGVTLARELGVPHLLEVNAPLADEQERTRGLLLGELARDSEAKILRGSSAVLVVSERLRAFAIRCGVPEHRVHVVPNGVDPRMFSAPPRENVVPSDLARRMAGKTVIGFSGSLKPWHGVETLIEAFGRVRHHAARAHLLIVGDGPWRERLERLTHELGLAESVSFAGAVPYADVPAWLAATSIAVAPYTPHEDFYFSPIKVFEYLAADRAVVAAAIGQVADLLRHEETALLYPPGDVGALALALERLIEDRALARRIATAGGEWVRRERTWASNARTVIEVARGLIEDRGADSGEALAAREDDR